MEQEAGKGRPATKGGKCVACGATIAWGKVDGRYRLFDPIHDERGAIVRREIRNGAGRVAMRPVPSAVRHSCVGVRNGVPMPPAGAPMEAPQPQPQPQPIVQPIVGPQGPQGPQPQPPDANVRDVVRAEMVAVLDEFGVQRPPQRIEVVLPDGKVNAIEGAAHEMLPALIGLVARRRHVYLGGPAGTGKTHGAVQAAEACGLRAVIQPMPGIQSASRVFGFEDAQGRFVSTVFADFFENGGVFVADEFDRMLPAVAAAFNAPLANGSAVFGGRSVRQHPDFVFVANGNTDMRGNDGEFTAAQPLDYATVSRFRYLHWGVDLSMERTLLRTIVPAAVATQIQDWFKSLRAAVEAGRVEKLLCGPRESLAVAADLVAGVPFAQAIESNVRRGLPAEEWAAVTRGIALPEGL